MTDVAGRALTTPEGDDARTTTTTTKVSWISRARGARLALILHVIVCTLVLIAIGANLAYHRFHKLAYHRFDYRVAEPCSRKVLLENLVPLRVQEDMLDLLARTDRFFADLGVEYWMNGGTLLGAEREGKLIAWDDDLDVGVRHSTWSAVDGSRLKKTLRAHRLALLRFVCVPVPKLVRLEDASEFDQCLFTTLTKVNHPPFLDVFEYDDKQRPCRTKDGNRKTSDRSGYWRLQNPAQQLLFPTDGFCPSELFPLRRYSVGVYGSPFRIEAWGPRNPEPNLTRNYGTDGKPTWRTIAIVSSHSSSTMCNPRRLKPRLASVVRLIEDIRRKEALQLARRAMPWAFEPGRVKQNRS